ncbi:MAG: hypothetical protein VX901_09635 [Candidatus Poribacteria bacterium]|nr:hypothetical protein [Candidatus Poribacteria bacterium]
MRKRTKSAKRILVEFQPKIEVVIDGYDVDDTYDIQNVVRIIDDCKMKFIDAVFPAGRLNIRSFGENFELGKDASGNPEKTYSRSKGWINSANSDAKFVEV